MKVYSEITELIGSTPLVKLKNYSEARGLEATVLAKVEFFNPAGSVKDRIAKAMLDDAEQKGLLKKGAVIIEPTSGNTGIGLASVAASRMFSLSTLNSCWVFASRQNTFTTRAPSIISSM